jgi:hypothetical protein
MPLLTALGATIGSGNASLGQPTIHLTSGSVAATDVGKIVKMANAGKFGQTVLVGKIVSVQGPQDFTLDVPAGGSVTSQEVMLVAPAYKTSFPTFPGYVQQPDIAGMQAAGLRFVPTILHHADNVEDPEVPVVDDAAYAAAVNKFIDAWKPDALIFGNEVDMTSNWPYVEGQGHAAYSHMISVGAKVAHARGLKCGAAAIMDYNLKHAVYRWLDQNLGHADAETYRKQMNGFSYDASRADLADNFLDDVKAAGCDAMVWHYYQDAAKAGGDATGYLALPRYSQYFDARFGGSHWNNEWGNRSYKVSGAAQAETDLRHLIQAFDGIDIEMAIAYGSGEGPNGPDPLWFKQEPNMGDATPEGQIGIDTIAGLP